MVEQRSLTVTAAAKLLHASEPTIRKLIVAGELDGSITTTSTGRRQFQTTRAAVETFLATRGSFPQARRKPASRLSSVERRLTDLERRTPTPITAAGPELQAEELRAVIRAQNKAFEQLTAAMHHQSDALDLLRRADAAQAQATKAALGAHESHREIVALYGIPDDPSELHDTPRAPSQ